MPGKQLCVVFVHGFISSSNVWGPFLRLLEDDQDLDFVRPLLFTYDTRLWQPDPRKQIPTFDTTADNLAQYLKSTAGDCGRIVLVAHSQGGLVVQRYLARMLGRGRGEDLRRIRRVILFACPNNGAEFGKAFQRAFLRKNPQADQLRPLVEQVSDTLGIVINQVVHAQEVSGHSCPIPFTVYAGESDNIVPPASARSVFPDAWTLPGDHSSVVKPDSHEHRAYEALKQEILDSADRGPPVAKDWKDLPAKPPQEVDGLLAALESIETLPYHLSGSRSLSDVYVQQQLRYLDTPSLATLERGETGKWGPPRLAGYAVDTHEHLVVVGGSGQGKSTLTLRLAAELSAAWRSEARRIAPPTRVPVIPIRVPADALLATQGDSKSATWTESLVLASNRELNLRQNAALSNELLKKPICGARWLILVDGLDRIRDPEARSHFIDVLVQHMQVTDSPYRLLITTQPLSFEELQRLEEGGADCLALDGFETEGALTDFARRWFRQHGGEVEAQRFLRSIDTAGLREVVQIPLLAAAAAVLFDPHRQLPHTKHDLYDDFISRIWEQQKLDKSFALLRQRLNGISGGKSLAAWIKKNMEPLLRHLAHLSVTTNEPLVPAAMDWISRNGPTISRRPHEWNALISEMLTSSGLLEHRGWDLQFLHEGIAEHLATAAAANTLPAQFDPYHLDWQQCIHQALGHTNPALARSVLIHHARQNESGDDLLSWLSRGNDRYQCLALELLAEGIPAQPAHLDAILPLIRHWICWADDTASRGLPLLASFPDNSKIPPLLQSIATDPTVDAAFRIEAADTLVHARPDLSPEIANALQQLIDEPIASSGAQATAAHLLAQLGPQYEGKVVEAFRTSVAEGINWEAKKLGLKALRPLVAQRHQEAAEVLLEFACNREDYLDFGGVREGAVNALLPVIDEVHLDQRRLAAALIEIGYWESASNLLRRLAESATPSLREGRPVKRTGEVEEPGDEPLAAVSDLLNEAEEELAPDSSISERRVARALREVVEHHETDATHLLRVAVLLDKLQEIRPSFKELYTAHPQPTFVQQPPEEHHQRRQEVINEITREIDEEIAADDFVAWQAPLLELAHQALDRHAPDGIIVKAFRHITRLHGVSSEILLEMAKMWADLGAEYYLEIVSVVRRIIGRQVDDPYVRIEAAQVLAQIGPQYVDEAAAALRQASLSPRVTPFDRYKAAIELACLGPQFSDDAITALCMGISDSPHFHDLQLNGAVRILLMCSPEHPKVRSEVEKGLRMLESYHDWGWWAAPRRQYFYPESA
ncbi:alpha/beta fold hydrolase [Streptomyces sp. NPDC002076]